MIYLVNLLPPSSGSNSLLMNRIPVQQVINVSNTGLLSLIEPWAVQPARDAFDNGVNIHARWHRLVL